MHSPIGGRLPAKGGGQPNAHHAHLRAPFGRDCGQRPFDHARPRRDDHPGRRWHQIGISLAPNADSYADLNSYSIVAKLTCGQKSFLFTGDAEADSEEEMLHAGYDLRSDVLKCGHHGSSTSTSAAFLQAVQPTYAVISCGVDNDYGHPHRETLDKLNDAGVQIYRTDEQDTILAVCDRDGRHLPDRPRISCQVKEHSHVSEKF